MRMVIAILGLLTMAVIHSSAAPIKEAPKRSSEKLRQLQKERVAALKEQLQGQYERVKIGKDPMITFLEAVRELGEAELDLAENYERRVAAIESMIKELSDAENAVAQLVNAGLRTKQGLAQVKAARLKAEIQLEKLKLSR